jgi:hypothetical protein
VQRTAPQAATPKCAADAAFFNHIDGLIELNLARGVPGYDNRIFQIDEVLVCQPIDRRHHFGGCVLIGVGDSD